MYKPLPFSSFIILLFLAVPESCYSQSDSQDSNADWDNTLEKAGDYIQLAVPIMAGVTTLIIKDYEGTKQFAFSYTTTLTLTYALKYVVHKHRPENQDQNKTPHRTKK